MVADRALSRTAAHLMGRSPQVFLNFVSLLPIRHSEQRTAQQKATDRPRPDHKTQGREVFDSVTYVALNSAIDGLAQRQRVIANNIANINTPNFQASRVQFEDQLSRAVERGNGAVQPTQQLSLEPTREDGNNVNLDTETLLNVDTVLRYQVASQAINGQFSSIRTALRTA